MTCHVSVCVIDTRLPHTANVCLLYGRDCGHVTGCDLCLSRGILMHGRVTRRACLSAASSASLGSDRTRGLKGAPCRRDLSGGRRQTRPAKYKADKIDKEFN